jgi:hypothetical protein
MATADGSAHLGSVKERKSIVRVGVAPLGITVCRVFVVGDIREVHRTILIATKIVIWRHGGKMIDTRFFNVDPSLQAAQNGSNHSPRTNKKKRRENGIFGQTRFD